MEFETHRARRLVLLMGCLVTIGCIWVICYYQIKHDRDQAKRTAEITASNFAKAFEEHIRSVVIQIDSTLRTMRDDYVQHPEYFKEQLAIYKKNLYHDLIIQVSVIDANGIMVFNEQSMPKVPLDLSDREHFKVHRTSSNDVLFISKPVLGRVSKRWSIQFTRKILRRDGTFGGVMVISVDPAFFTSFFHSFDLGKDGVVSFLGMDRVVRARSMGTGHVETLPAVRPFFHADQPDAGIFDALSAIDGVERIFAYRRFKNYPLIVSVGLADKTVYSAVDSRKNILILLAAFLSALLLIGTRIIFFFDKQQSRTEQSLREAKQRLELATASGHLGVWQWDITTGGLTWDSRMHELYGTDPKRFSNSYSSFENAVHPADRRGMLRALEATIKGEKTEFCAEFRIIRPDGDIRMIKADGLVTRDGAGRAVRMIGLNSDITERVAAVNALRESEKRFRTLAEASFEGIAIIDHERYLDVNSQLASMLGFQRSELIGMEVSATLPPESANAMASVMGGSAGQNEHEMLCKDGSRRFVEVHGQSISQNDRDLRITAIRDITERKRMEKALHDSEEQFRTLCDAAPVGIFRSDEAGRTIYCNPRWEEITGISATEAIGQRWIDWSHPDDVEETVNAWDKAVAGAEVFSGEHRLLTPQGKAVWVRTLANPLLGPGGAVISYVGTFEDITDLRQARQDMLKTQKLQSLGVLAGGIAHDFNNILTAIFTNVSLARMQVNDPEKARVRLKEAESAITRATDLTKQLLTFSRGGTPIKKMISVNDVLRESAGFVMHGSKTSSRFDLADDLWAVQADEGQIAQVVHNLVLNAIQAMPDGGTITVASQNAASAAGGRFVKISVADTGTGIPEKILHEIFDPYFTTKPGGNGLGLATCYSIVNKHGGTITVTSTEGAGSVFTVSLPASDQEVVAGPADRSEVVRGSGRILVMDDEPSIRDAAQAILEELGYSVEVAEHGSAALQLYLKRKREGNRFSAVILDMTVPGGLGGKETMERLLKLDPEVKAIVSSGYSNDTVMANYRDYGFRAVLTKPYLPEQLSQILAEVAGSEG